MSAQDINRKVKIDFMGNVRDLVSKLKGAGSEADKLKGKLQNVGTAGSKGLNNVGNAAQGAKRDLAAAAVAVQGMTSQIAGMGQQILDFDTKVLTLQKTILGVRSQEVALRRQQEDLNTAVEEGTIDLQTYNRSIEDIQLAYQNMVLEQKVVAAETKKLDGEFVTFGVNAVGTVTQIAIAMKAMGISGVAALGGLVTGLKAVSGALWRIAKHPVFLIITAGILAWELGLKSIVENLTGIDDLGIFSNLEKAFNGLTEGPNSMEELDMQTQSFTESVKTATPFIEKQNAALGETSSKVGQVNSLYADMARQADKTKRSIDGLNTSLATGFSSGPLVGGLPGAGGGGGISSSGSAGVSSFYRNLISQQDQYLNNLRDIKREEMFRSQGLGKATREILARISAANAEPIESRFGEEIGEHMAQVLENLNLQAINQMFDLAEQEAGKGNIQGALNLERQAQQMGNSGRNISGFLTMTLDSMKAAGRTRNSFSNAGIVTGTSVSRSGSTSGRSSFGGRSLTKSTARRRSGRNRNPMGRNDKGRVRRIKAAQAQAQRLNREFGIDFGRFTGVGQMKFRRRFTPVRVTNKNGSFLSFSAGRSQRGKAFTEFLAKTEAIGRQRMAKFNDVTTGTSGMMEALQLITQGFGVDQFAIFDASEGFKNKIQDVIQSRNFFRGKAVDFDGMDKSGIAGLLNIREHGYREMNEQLAFQGEEQYQTVGT